MPPKLYMFRLPQGTFALTSDATGSRLPQDHLLGYTKGDWMFVATVFSANLKNMIVNSKRIEPEIARAGYYSILQSDIIFNHRFWIQYDPHLYT